MRPGGWSFQQNTRLSKNNWQMNLAAAKKGGLPFSLAVRKIMETTHDFKTAVKKLYATKFMAPQYFVVTGAGAYEGSVLTIDRLGKHQRGTPPIQNVSNTSWHLVQTNDDLLGAPADARRPLANDLLGLSQQKLGSTDSLMQFMHTSQLLNPYTVYSTVMVPATGYFKTVLPNEPPAVKSGEQAQNWGHMFGSFQTAWLQQHAGLHEVKEVVPQSPKQISHRKKKFLASRVEGDTISFMQFSSKLKAKRSIPASARKSKRKAHIPIEEL